MTSTPSLPAQMEKVRWHIEYWKSRNLNDHAQEMCDVLVTLQQHERLEAALRLIAAFEGKTLITASDDPHERQAYSLGAHRAFAQASGIASDALDALDTAAPDKPEDAERDG